VPGTLTTVTFASATTWVANDIYTIDTLGGITLTGSGPAASNVTQVSSPLDAYSVIVTITTAGALGTAVFTYSGRRGQQRQRADRHPHRRGQVRHRQHRGGDDLRGHLHRGGHLRVDHHRGGVLDLGPDHRAGGPARGGPRVGLRARGGDLGQRRRGAAAAAIVDTQMAAAEVQFRFAFGIIECPTTESDSTVATAFASFSSLRTMVCAGDVGAVSPINGRILRRNCAWIVAAHLAGIQPGEDAGFVGSRTPIRNVASLYRDEQKTQFLDAQRFATMRTIPGRAGYYITNGNMMAPSGSDFNLVQRRRVMDVACRITRQAELPYLNGSVRINSTQRHHRRARRPAVRGEGQLASSGVGVVSTG
jgi:hypothetical protein